MIKALKRGLGFTFVKVISFINSCIYERYRKKYNLNSSFRFNGSNILFYGDGAISVGEESYIGEYSTVQAVSGCTVTIGRKCQISHNVRIYTASDIADQDFSISTKASKIGNVIISDYVWIGANVFINPGVTIGENAIVGANSVITRDVEPFTIVGGVPAKVIRKKYSKC